MIAAALRLRSRERLTRAKQALGNHPCSAVTDGLLGDIIQACEQLVRVAVLIGLGRGVDVVVCGAFERVGKTSGLGVRRWHCNRAAPMDHLFAEVPVTARWGLSVGHHGAATGAAPPNFFFEGGQVTPLSWKCPEAWGCTA